MRPSPCTVATRHGRAACVCRASALLRARRNRARLSCGAFDRRLLTGTRQLSASWGLGRNFKKVSVIESGGDGAFLVALFVAVSSALAVGRGGSRLRVPERGSGTRGIENPGLPEADAEPVTKMAGFSQEGHTGIRPRGPPVALPCGTAGRGRGGLGRWASVQAGHAARPRVRMAATLDVSFPSESKNLDFMQRLEVM